MRPISHLAFTPARTNEPSLSLSLPLSSCLSKEVDVSEWRSEFFADMQRFSCVCATIRCVEVALGVHHVMPQDLINYRVWDVSNKPFIIIFFCCKYVFIVVRRIRNRSATSDADPPSANIASSLDASASWIERSGLRCVMPWGDSESALRQSLCEM